MLKGAAGRLETALAADRIDHDVIKYPEANHSFLDRHERLTGWLMARFGFGYRQQEAPDARRRILAFFDTHLR